MQQPRNKTTSRWRTLSLVLAGIMIGGALIGPVSAAVSLDRDDRRFVRKTARKIANKRKKKVIKQLQPQINANAAALPRVAVGVDNTDALPAAPNMDLVGTSIVAPAPGYLHLNGGADFHNDGSFDIFDCVLVIDGVEIESSLRREDMNALSSDDQDDDCQTHTVVPVPAGGHSVSFRVLIIDTAETEVDNKVVSAMWVPFGPTGAPPTDFTIKSPKRADLEASQREAEQREAEVNAAR